MAKDSYEEMALEFFPDWQEYDDFQVIIRHTADDLPVSIHQDIGEAFERAHEVFNDIDGWTDKINKIVQTDASTPICVAIAQFREGELIRHEVIKSLNTNVTPENGGESGE